MTDERYWTDESKKKKKEKRKSIRNKKMKSANIKTKANDAYRPLPTKEDINKPRDPADVSMCARSYCLSRPEASTMVQCLCHGPKNYFGSGKWHPVII